VTCNNFYADTLCFAVTLTFDPLTLNCCSRSWRRMRRVG